MNKEGERIMRRKIVLALIIFVCFILQSTLFQTWAMASVSPNLLIIVTASVGFMRGEKEGIVVGFLCGMLLDIFFGSLLGAYALLYMLIGYGNGMFHAVFYDEDLKLPLVWIAVSELAYGLLVYFLLFLMRSKFEFGYYLTHIIIPELIYTILVSLVLYRIIRYVNRKLEAIEEERTEEF